MATEEKRTTVTCGTPAKATSFCYSGNLDSGMELHFETATVKITARFLSAVLTEFRGNSVPCGFSMTDPKRGGYLGT